MGMKYSMDSEFYCVKCGNKGMPIIRKKGSERNAGHLKKLFCLKCNEEINHAECREFTHYTKADFDFEREHGNFDDKQNRIMEYGLFRAEMNKKGIELP